jgi:hypothetical protein
MAFPFPGLFGTLPHGESERQSVRLIATRAATRQSVGTWIICGHLDYSLFLNRLPGPPFAMMEVSMAERSFAREVQQLRLSAGARFRGEGIPGNHQGAAGKTGSSVPRPPR